MAKKKKFNRRKEPWKKAVAYVDGSYYMNEGVYGWGWILFWVEGEWEKTEEKKTVQKWGGGNDPELVGMHNVAGEITAAEDVTRYAYEHDCTSLTIYHDYMGISKWARREWRANKVGTKRYQEVMDDFYHKMYLTFRHVKGHSGNKWNDVADELANRGAKEFIEQQEFVLGEQQAGDSEEA